MKKSIKISIISGMLLVGATTIQAQVVKQKIGDNPTIISASTILEIESANKGVLLPRIALTAIDDATTIVAPANSLLIYNTATAGTAPNDVTPGFYYWNATATRWNKLGSGNNWSLAGNTGTTAGTDYIGTTDAIDFVTKTNNTEAMRVTSTGNVGIGTTTPTSKLQTNGSFALPVLAATGNITLDATHATIRIDATTADVTVTLPAASTATGRVYTVIKSDASINKIIFSEAVQGNGFTFTQANLPGNYNIQSNGTNWVLID